MKNKLKKIICPIILTLLLMSVTVAGENIYEFTQGSNEKFTKQEVNFISPKNNIGDFTIKMNDLSEEEWSYDNKSSHPCAMKNLVITVTDFNLGLKPELKGCDALLFKVNISDTSKIKFIKDNRKEQYIAVDKNGTVSFPIGIETSEFSETEQLEFNDEITLELIGYVSTRSGTYSFTTAQYYDLDNKICNIKNTEMFKLTE